ncbi:hypothetical protein ACQJBY_066655 [Aegilops geniculata]
MYKFEQFDYSLYFTMRVRGTVREVTLAGASPLPIGWRRQGEGRQGCAALCTAVKVQHRYDIFLWLSPLACFSSTTISIWLAFAHVILVEVDRLCATRRGATIIFILAHVVQFSFHMKEIQAMDA